MIKIIDRDSPIFSDYNIALFALIFMNIQIMPLEGWPISMPKVIFMAISPLIILIRSPHFSKASAWGCLFWFITVGLSLFQYGPTRMSTFYYTALFLFVFNLYYNLIYINRVFDIDQFINIVRFVIGAYAICLVLQEISFLVGLRYNPFLNMMGFGYFELFRLPSLGIEPSSSARTLAVFFYALLKTTEYKLGEAPTIKYLYQEYKWTIIGFLYTMFAMGSGTAIVCLAILSLYFVKKKYCIFILIASFALYMLLPLLDYTPINRALGVFNAAITGDTELVSKTDHSAATRVNIIIDTFKYLDLTDSELWIGKGVDASQFEEHQIVSGIVDYGLISYLLKFGMFLSCCFTGFLSLETLMFILIFGLNIGNIAYGWGALMVFSTIRYFKYNFNIDEYEMGKGYNDEESYCRQE